jgi:hypothetical protein
VKAGTFQLKKTVSLVGIITFQSPLRRLYKPVLRNFDKPMKIQIKIILLTLLIGMIATLGFVGFGLYSMEIEDHYGDLQVFYYDSESGDIIVNKTTSKFGFVEKNWKRINIRTKEIDSTDLYNWVYQNGNETKIEIYRPIKVKIGLNDITYSELNKLIENYELKLISKN